MRLVLEIPPAKRGARMEWPKPADDMTSLLFKLPRPARTLDCKRYDADVVAWFPASDRAPMFTLASGRRSDGAEAAVRELDEYVRELETLGTVVIVTAGAVSPEGFKVYDAEGQQAWFDGFVVEGEWTREELLGE